jgi:prolipoprotein diacylglyceryltransferase
MYPNFYYIFQDWFGLEIDGLKLINSFGFFVAMSFILANYIMTKELKRKFNDGVLGKKQFITILKGKAFSVSDYVTAAITGFIIGYKFLPVLIDFSVVNNDPQSYILSAKGDFIYGLLVMLAFLGFNYWQDKKQRLPQVVKEQKQIDPSYHMGAITMAAFIGGIFGAKLFHILENMSQFYANPMDSILSFSGLTYYGGLIVGAASVLFVAHKRGIPVLHMLDVGGPAMMLAYGTGRIGCHVSGDGDWGIVNELPKPKWMNLLPDWMWAYNYPNNVNKDCNPFSETDPRYLENINCDFNETPYLIANVFPTPLYEAIACTILFFILWMLRKRLKYAGVLFGIYLILNGLERFLIEKIRVNNNMDNFNMTQAEIISFSLMLLGTLLIVFSLNKKIPVKGTDNMA